MTRIGHCKRCCFAAASFSSLLLFLLVFFLPFIATALHCFSYHQGTLNPRSVEHGLGALGRDTFHNKTNLTQTVNVRLPGYTGHMPSNSLKVPKRVPGEVSAAAPLLLLLLLWFKRGGAALPLLLLGAINREYRSISARGRLLGRQELGGSGIGFIASRRAWFPLVTHWHLQHELASILCSFPNHVVFLFPFCFGAWFFLHGNL